jgi:4-amino-4-deoxy-L-arabinose transferase-like glycosyltransferase
MKAMFGILLISTYFLTVFQILLCTSNGRIRKAFLSAYILTAITLVLITEMLSYWNLLDFQHLSSLWIIFCCIAIFLMSLNFQKMKTLHTNYWLSECIRSRFRAWSSLPSLHGNYITYLCLVSVLLIAVITLIAAMVSPPNTYDSMTYHMTRVAHWINQQSVSHYQTSNVRQLDLAPLSEFTILNLQILSGGDHFANLVQWFSFVGSLLGVSLISKQLGGDNKVQILTIFFCATIPMGILQASSTQNDYVVSLWLVCMVYFLVGWIHQPRNIFNLYMLASSFGLAIFTKGTAYVFSIPIFLLALFFTFKERRCIKRAVSDTFLSFFLIILPLNISHWARNASIFASPLGISGKSTLTQELTFQLFLSNLLKNASPHLVFPFDFFNQIVFFTLKNIHNLLNVDIDDPRTTFLFVPQFTFPAFSFNFFHEDGSGNLIHFFLLNFSLLFTLTQIRRNKNQVFIYSLFVLGLICSYSLLVAWQPWASRLHLPIFVLASPIIASTLDKLFSYSKPQKDTLCFVLILIIGLSSTPYLFFNAMKPFNRLFATPRLEQYFAAAPHYFTPYLDSMEYLGELQCSDVGLIFGANTYEYPLWAISRAESKLDHSFTHLFVNNESRKINEENKKTDLCAIIVSQDEKAKKEMIFLEARPFYLDFSSDPLSIYRPKA